MAENTEEVKIETCPRCGLNLDKTKSSAPSEEDKKEYIRSVLGDKTFQKSFHFLGGALKVTFRELNTAETNLLYQEIRDMPGDDSVMIKALRVKMMASTVDVTRGGKKTEGWKGAELTVDKAEEEYKRVFGTLPENVSGAVHGAFAVFSNLVRDIGSACMDKDF